MQLPSIPYNRNSRTRSSRIGTRPQTRSRLRDDFDGAWKNMLSERRFADFIAFFLPDVYPQIDWTLPPVFITISTGYWPCQSD